MRQESEKGVYIVVNDARLFIVGVGALFVAASVRS